jgi:uncharacterized protein (TIGR02145 family)
LKTTKKSEHLKLLKNKTMKKIYTFLTVLILAGSLLAQAPQSFNYQAVVRDASGNIIANTQVSMKISILQGSVTGTTVCEEEFNPTTNDFGLVTLAIGSVNTTDFAAIDWSDGPYFIKVELDPAGGTSYAEMGTSQLLSVPFALYAETVENVNDDDPDPSNELQAISINNDTLYLSDGGQVYLGYLLDDADTQKLVLNDYYLGITNGNEITLPSVWNRLDQDISYDSGKVSITAQKGDIQLHLTDAFSAGGHNLIVGDDSYLSDIDMYNTLGIFGIPDSTIGAIKLGADGPVISGSSTNLNVNKEIDMNNQKVVNLADPVNDQDASTKAYVDALGLKLKAKGLLPYEAGDSVTFTYNGTEVTYGTVEYDGKVWMDRNLGASQVATAYNDQAGYGDLFQWGREDDGHQVRTSTTVEGDMSLTDQPGHGNFITETTAPYDWADNSWITRWLDGDGKKSTADPCPTGWRLPTDSEWQSVIDYGSWSNQTDAFSSALKLPSAGFRLYNTGTVGYGGQYGRYWSSTPHTENGYYLNISSDTAGIPHYTRATGFSVRCILDIRE